MSLTSNAVYCIECPPPTFKNLYSLKTFYYCGFSTGFWFNFKTFLTGKTSSASFHFKELKHGITAEVVFYLIFTALSILSYFWKPFSFIHE